jgi:hypothetical protein
MIESVWNGPRSYVDALRMVDHLLRATAKNLQQWSDKAMEHQIPNLGH